MIPTELLAVVVSATIVCLYLLLRRLGRQLVDYWFIRWEKHQEEQEWSRRYGKGPHGD